MADEFGEKTEPATPKRRSQLREEGNVPKSTDLAAIMTLAAAILPLMFLSDFILRNWAGLMHRLLSGHSTGNLLSVDSVFGDLYLSFRSGLIVLLPFTLLSFFATAGTMAAQVGLRITFEPLRPSASKLSPIEGAKKFFDIGSLMRLGTSLAKVITALVVAVTYLSAHHLTILALPRMELGQAAASAADLVMQLCIWLLIVLLVLALIDLIYQRWKWERDNRMSKEEIKEEAKNIMGDPKIKKRQREFAMQILRQRTSQIVPEADVIVTNPEHLSIALKWDPETMKAPKVLAKGADYLALRIRQIAVLHGIPIVERKPLARAMYPIVEPGREIPSQFFAPVAEILAYVYRLEGRKVG